MTSAASINLGFGRYDETSTGGIADAVDAWENVRAMSSEDFGGDDDFDGEDNDSSSSIMHNGSNKIKKNPRRRKPESVETTVLGAKHQSMVTPPTDFAKLSTTDE